ncbi:MarR family winged helix-turn-helix transcriptional regulator [Novosphingobium album (ex Hu et al. 2023)]|uniref:MarR family transcriptional regulator n=1 Tax=Novosphingobium album (ex Hu et al. 2023) TaxID=2930093 RepID=A0ABT0AZY7_9SPHN|nr:helix-turn-helix domain-containing protein [Novosphingobium album (ex Hu et al. 2023)]MCJ2178391.1 MarR family transcriptional regulator [Novosphingobium album (ex Hu et al. 2023)]
MGGPVTSNPFLAVIDEILRLRSCFEDLFAELSDAADMSVLQQLVLFAVFDAPVPPTVPQIGRDLGHPRQVIQRIVNEMVEKGLLAKADNPHHKRAMLLLPTEKAQDLKRRAEARAFETAEAFLSHFSADRCAALTGELGVLRQALESYIDRHGLAAKDKAASGSQVAGALALLERFG